MSKNKINLENIFPFLTWFRELKSFHVLRSDIIAGLTVSLVLIPQSMAYAQLAGLPLAVGLYTSFIPVIVAGLFGSSRQMSTGPITIISLMTATSLASIIGGGNTDLYIAYASILAIFIGIFYLILGTLRLGVVVNFLSHPVIIGFTNAVAIITIISQIGKIFLLNGVKGDNSGELIYNLIAKIIESTHYPTLIFGICSIILLIFLKRFFPKLPRILILLVLSIFISYKIGFEINYGGNIVKDIPSNLPSFNIPFLNNEFLNDFSINKIFDLMFFAIVIGIIGFTQSISVAKFIGTKTNQRVSANRELIGQGLSNLSSGFFGGYGVAGSLSKTAVNLRTGAKTGLSSIVTGLSVGFTLLFFTKFLYHLPIVVLASVIIVAVSDLIKVKPIIKALKTDRHDGIIAIITFLLTLILNPKIELAIFVGVVLSLSLFIYRSMNPRIVEVSMYKDGLYRDIEIFGLKPSKHISVIRFDGVLYFANAGYFEDNIIELIEKKGKIKYIILDLERMADIDSTGIESIKNIYYRYQELGIKILFTGLRIKVISKFMNHGFIDKIGKKNIFVHVEKALDYIYEKKGDDIDIEPLEEYISKKNGKKELGRYLVKKYISK